jgi:hypothetical protein
MTNLLSALILLKRLKLGMFIASKYNQLISSLNLCIFNPQSEPSNPGGTNFVPFVKFEILRASLTIPSFPSSAVVLLDQRRH